MAAFFDSLLSRAPGSPKLPEMPGAAPAVSTPRTSVAPPAAASGPVGRPPSPIPAFPGGAGPSLPLSSAGSQAAPLAPPASASSVRPTTGAAASHPIENPPMTSGPTPAPAAPAAPGLPAQAPTGTASLAGGTAVPGASIALGHVPTSAEMLDYPGMTVNTPYGTMNPDGSINLNPAGQQAYQQKITQQRSRYGPHPFANVPGVPPVPVSLGKPMFNVHTGTWIDRPAGWGRS